MQCEFGGTMSFWLKETNTPALEEAKCIHQNSLIQSHNEYVE